MAESNAMRSVNCPHCGKPAPWDAVANPYRPFCSERCRLIDLGAWASETYRVPLQGDPEDEIEVPTRPAGGEPQEH